MAKDKLTDYDSTAANNLDVGGISVAEGMLPSGVNNAIRELMSHQADAFGAGTPLYVDQTNNRVGVGTSSPATRLSIGDSTVNSENVMTFGKRVTSAQSNLPVIGHTSHDGTASDLGICATSSGGNIIFYTGNDAAGFGTGSNAERLRILSSGGITFNGDTAAANALDDYEEGTWTPAYTDDSGNAVSNVTSLSGRYVKVGKLVYISGSIRTQGSSSTSGVSGNLNISGLPFTCVNITGTGHINFHTNEFTATYNAPSELPRSSPVKENTTRIAIYKYSGTGGRTTLFQVTDLYMAGNSNFMYFGGTYETS